MIKLVRMMFKVALIAFFIVGFALFALTFRIALELCVRGACGQ